MLTLQEQLEKQRQLIAQMARFPEMNPGPVLRMDQESRILLSNSAAVAVLGDNLVDQVWLNICPGLNRETWNLILNSKKVVPFETTIGDRVFVFNHRCDPETSLVFAYGTDITVNKENEKKLEEQRAAIAEIARFPDMNPGPVLRMSLDGEIKLSNKAAQDLFGENITGDNWLQTCPGMNSQIWEKIKLTEKVYPFETTVNQKDFVFNHRMDYQTSLVFVFGTDVTLQKKVEKQLRHAEKMASLGELTAGIAHEIQNPLNFVNNFSELNSELIGELKDELEAGNIESAREIASDIQENEKKINHHGKRADAIVKSMLQHSKTSSGQKELTDINALADEFLRLAYHGLRATDREFQASFKTDFDPAIEKLLVVSQDIGRVLLNLINNAFYAVSEKNKTTSDKSYVPTVIVKTAKFNDHVEIAVEDNGSGISSSIMEKIFQPFFTTKPTGEGTGLGLSLSFDIIKAHGGEIKVQTEKDRYTRFIIQLPVDIN